MSAGAVTGGPAAVPVNPPSFAQLTPTGGLPMGMGVVQGAGHASAGAAGVGPRMGAAFDNPRIRDSHFEMMSNNRDTHAVVVRPVSHTHTNASVVGSLLWKCRDNGQPPSGRSNIEAQRPLVVDTPTLNFLLAKLAERADSAGTKYDRVDPNVVWAQYTFYGVGLNEQGSDRYPGRRPNIRMAEKMVQTQVGGFCAAQNLFKGFVGSGQRLYAVVRLENVAGRVFHLGADVAAEHKAIRSGKPIYAWQVTPTCALDEDVVTYKGQDGVRCRSSVEEIARAGNVPARLHTGVEVQQPPTSQVEALHAVSIPIFLAENTP